MEQSEKITNGTGKNRREQIYLLLAAPGAFVLVAAVLLFANKFVAVGEVVDTSYFQLALTLLICLLITVVLFGFLNGSTASMEIPTWQKGAITLGGPIAGFAALLWFIFPNLTPATKLTLYLTDASSTETAGEHEFNAVEGLEVILQTQEGRIARTIYSDTQFGFLPKGVNLPITVSSPRWRLTKIEPGDCSAGNSHSFSIRSGCRVAWLGLMPTKESTFTGVPDLPPVGLQFAEGSSVNLKQVVEAFVRELQQAVTLRNQNAVIDSPDWRTLGSERTDASFRWRSPPDTAKACVVASTIQDSFNADHPENQISVVVEVSGIDVLNHGQTRNRENDACRS